MLAIAIPFEKCSAYVPQPVLISKLSTYDRAAYMINRGSQAELELLLGLRLTCDTSGLLHSITWNEMTLQKQVNSNCLTTGWR